MNCKPGDLAIIIGGSEWSGMIVEIICRAPIGRFVLPNGDSAIGYCSDGWVVKFQRKVRVPLVLGGWLMTEYGSGTDSKLRPLPGNLTEDELDAELTA